jgi:isocitrate dehydrogenase (NAD+)
LPGTLEREKFGFQRFCRGPATILDAVHGLTPDIAGNGLANPLALLLAACLMLDHIGRADSAGRIRKAMIACLNTDGVRTPDPGGNASTSDVTQSIIRRWEDSR